MDSYDECMSDPQPLPNSAAHKRPWLQFSLRTLLAAMLVVAIVLGWFVNRVRTQQIAVSKIISYGGQINYDYQFDADGKLRRDRFGNYLHGLEPPGPRWLRERLGDDYFRSPVKVYLEIDEGVGFEDRDLAALAGALELLPTLKALSLKGSPITDAGLEHLRGLSQLQELDCQWTKVTDGGIESLQQHLPECRIVR